MKPKELFSHWDQIRSDLISTIQSFTEDELHFVPFEGSWPVGRIMLHIADAEDGWLRYVITTEISAWPDEYNLQHYPDKKAILEVLAEVHQRTVSYLSGLGEEDLSRKVKTPWGREIRQLWIWWHVIEHEIHHRGELSLILGLLGKEGLDV